MTDSGYRCPTNPDHGRLILLKTDSEKSLYCPHSDHSKNGDIGMFSWGDVDETYKLEIIKRAKAAHVIKRRKAKATN